MLFTNHRRLVLHAHTNVEKISNSTNDNIDHIGLFVLIVATFIHIRVKRMKNEEREKNRFNNRIDGDDH